jgi:glutaredoxin
MRNFASLVILLFTIVTASQARIDTDAAAAPTSQGVEIYTIPGCFGCGSAKSMFEDRGIPFTEISLKGRPDLYRQMKERVYSQMEKDARGSMEDIMTVPRIFIQGKYIGGFGDLDGATLDKLAAQLKSNSAPASPSAANQSSTNDES